MINIKQLKHSVIAGLEGAKEGILEIADKMNLTVLKAKLLLEIFEHEEQIRKNYASLGKLAYQLKASQDLHSIIENQEVNTLLETCRGHEEKLSKLRQRHHELDENQLDDHMNSLKQLLEQKNMQIVKLTLSSKSLIKGRTINQIQLPPDLLVLCVQKHNRRLMIAKGDTRLDERDCIFVLGSEKEIKRIKEQL